MWLIGVFHRKKGGGKQNLPNPYAEYKFILKNGAFKKIMAIKGWHTYQEAGEELGFTRQYISMIVNGKARITCEFMARLAVLLGNVKKGWWTPFELVMIGHFDLNHPHWNNEKYMGRVPYERYSPTGNMRKQDYEVEEKNK